MVAFSVWRAGRLALQAAAAAGAVCTAVLWLLAPMAGWMDWSGDPWIRIAPPAAARQAAAPAQPGALVSLIEVRTGSAAPERIAVLRDGRSDGELAAGPLTIAVRPGDDIALRNQGPIGAAVRVLAAGDLRWPMRGELITVPAGLTETGRVR